MKPASLCFFTVLAFTASAQAASYATDFQDFPLGDINGRKDWSVDDPRTDIANVIQWGPSGTQNKAASIGFGYKDEFDNFMPTYSTVNLTHAYGGQFVSNDNVGTSVNLNFGIEDSGTAFPNRDTFGISLTTTGGANLFKVTFTPTTQVADPSVSPPLGVWAVTYTVGGGSPSTTGWGVQEGDSNSFVLNFTAAGATTNFSLTINDHNWTGDALISPTAVIDNFNATWKPFKDPTVPGNADQAGSNALIFDNLSVVPEPSSALLICLAGLGFVARRKRV